MGLHLCVGYDYPGPFLYCSYSSFDHFKKLLARTAGLKFINPDLPGITLTDTFAKDDPIYDLITHSDCNGELTLAQIQIILPRMRYLLAILPDDPFREGAFNYGIKLADKMEKCIKESVCLVFS